MRYIFDVDGTLTPSRDVIDTEFKIWFKRFIELYPVSLVTGSDREKTVEQLGQDIVDSVEYCFNCAGNAVYKNGNLIYKSDWILPDEPWQFLENYLYQSKYDKKYGRHFEQRIGLLNFSVVGRQAIGQQRTDYYEWDRVHNERDNLVKIINKRWPDLQAAAGGETGIDIFARGRDKAQILDRLEGKISFFGDRIDPNGNDYSLAMRIVDENRGQCYNVSNWNHTYTLLRELCPDVSASLANGSTIPDR
jgi:phosphomannomutase